MGVAPHDLLLGHDQLQESGAFLGLFKFFSHRFLGFRHRTPDAMTLALELTAMQGLGNFGIAGSFGPEFEAPPRPVQAAIRQIRGTFNLLFTPAVEEQLRTLIIRGFAMTELTILGNAPAADQPSMLAMDARCMTSRTALDCP